MAVIHINNKNFKTEVFNSKLPVILDFWAPWCGPCQMMGPLFESLSVEYEGKLKFGKINTDENPDISNEFGIQGIPCLIVTKNGIESDRIVGFMPKPALKNKIDSILHKIK